MVKNPEEVDFNQRSFNRYNKLFHCKVKVRLKTCPRLRYKHETKIQAYRENIGQ